MLVDARVLPAGETIETEVCIIGAGPAGLSLAQEFIGRDIRVCLLETGGLEPDDEIQSLSSGETVGSYVGLETSRRRQVGGMSNEWTIELNAEERGVRYVALDEIDFEQRDWIPYSGWAINRSTLIPYYERAQKVCGAGPFTYRVEDWEDEQSPCLPLSDDRVETSMFQFGFQRVFTETHRDRVIQSPTVTLYTCGTAVELETNDTAQTVERVRVATLTGQQFWVSARFFILTSGAIESARLLLLSNKVQPNGLGNEQDVVGRFFMDHPFICTGEFVPKDRQLFNHTDLYDRRIVNGTHVMAKLALSSDTLRQEKLIHLCTKLFPRYPIYRTEAARAVKKMFMSQYMGLKQSAHSESVRSLRRLVKGMTQGTKSPKEMGQLAMNIGKGMGDILKATYRAAVIDPLQPDIPADMARCGWSEWTNKEKKFGFFELWSLAEQSPDPENRLTLSDHVDRLGCRKAKIHWRWSESDMERIVRSQDILADAIMQSGLGEVKIYRDGNKPFMMSSTAHHHMGTTRMNADPKQGVVDANCKVHGVSNLFVASSAVFPTGGYANPTLTIVALALRVADRVQQLIAGSEVELSPPSGAAPLDEAIASKPPSVAAES